MGGSVVEAVGQHQAGGENKQRASQRLQEESQPLFQAEWKKHRVKGESRILLRKDTTIRGEKRSRNRGT